MVDLTIYIFLFPIKAVANRHVRSFFLVLLRKRTTRTRQRLWTRESDNLKAEGDPGWGPQTATPTIEMRRANNGQGTLHFLFSRIQVNRGGD